MIYARNADGFPTLHPFPPGAGYTLLDDQPAGPLSAVAEWWRAVDRGGLSSDWHPSLQGGMETALPPGIAGSGVNIWPARYSNFEEPDRVPEFYTNGCTVDRVEPGYNGKYALRITATADGGEVYFTALPTEFNFKLTPNLRWILSGYFFNNAAAQDFTARFLTIGGEEYDVPGQVAPVGTWHRKSTAIDLRQDNSIGGMFAITIPTTGGVILLDALMCEEYIGSTPTPSAYYAPPTIVTGEQIVEGTVGYSKAVQTSEFARVIASSTPQIIWTPLAPLARVRGSITLSANLELQRATADTAADFVATFYRAGVVVKAITVTLLPGQLQSIVVAEWVDESRELAAIAYQFGIHCPAETLEWRGVGRIQEMKR